MSKTVALAVAVALSLTLTATAVFADDQTPSGSTKEEQATKARQAKAQQNQDMMLKASQDPQGRNANIEKSAEASKAGPTPQRDYINTPEAEQRVMKNKGQ